MIEQINIALEQKGPEFSVAYNIEAHVGDQRQKKESIYIN